jgi:uncharacterized membrane protein
MVNFKFKKMNEYNVVSIRYNTKSDGSVNRWRLLCDGNEHLTNNIVINGKVRTTTDWMGNEIGYKHHITIRNAVVEYCVDYVLIKNKEKRLFRDILKTITYRILGTSVTFGIGYLSTGNIGVATALGFSDLILKPLVYFLHERMWSKIKNY